MKIPHIFSVFVLLLIFPLLIFGFEIVPNSKSHSDMRLDETNGNMPRAFCVFVCLSVVVVVAVWIVGMGTEYYVRVRSRVMQMDFRI